VVRILDHDRAGREIAQALALAVDEQHDDAHPIRIRQEVDDADHVANPRLHKRHRFTAVTHCAQAEDLLAHGLAGPERLAGPEVAEDDDEAADDRDQVRDHVEARGSDRDRGEIQAQQDTREDQQVEDLRDRTGAEAGDLVVERHPFRGGNDEVGVRKRLVHIVK